MRKIRIAINGFGRIGRSFLRAAYERDDMEIVAINDLTDIGTLAYLLTYDTVAGVFPHAVHVAEDVLHVNEASIQVFSERDPKKLPWADMHIDVVVEATGFFTQYDAAYAHIEAGARRVVISAPGKDAQEVGAPQGATVLMGVNEDAYKNVQVTSNASCTTNAASPLIGLLQEQIGIEQALLNTIHAYTATQALVDGPDRGDLRKGRAAAQNIVPTSTGAAIATTKAHTDLAGRFDGIAVRVPVAAGSLVDVTFVASRATSVEEVNTILTRGAEESRYTDIFTVTNEPLVSSDIVGMPYAAIADLAMTRVVGGTLVKVLAWYDNESGYTQTLVRHVALVG